MISDALQAHLETGCTTVCRCWAVTRRDGVVLGFTDHDRALGFDGVEFRADSGLSARALERSTSLKVDNSEAVGALSDASIREADIRAGLFDRAEVRAWLVNWSDVDERRMIFRGSLGEIERADGAFRAELRGLAEALNEPQGLVYQRPCSAVLGDARCGVDLALHRFDATVVASEDGLILDVSVADAPTEGWFSNGGIDVLDGAMAGRGGLVREDFGSAPRRLILWEALEGLAPGDAVRLTAGCDKRLETCRGRFGNVLNFRGFPDIPGEDWLMSYPVRSARNDGGSRR